MRVVEEPRAYQAAGSLAEELPYWGWLGDGHTCLTRSGELIAAGRLRPAAVDGRTPEQIDRVLGLWQRLLSGLSPDARLYFYLLRRPMAVARDLESSAASCLSGCTGAPQARRGATSPSSCPSRLMARARCSSTPIRATRPPRASTPGGALRERGRPVESVAVVLGGREFERAEKVLGNWTAPARSPGRSKASAAGHRIRREIDRIEQAIRGMDESVIQAYGSLQGCLARIVELRAALPTAPSEAMIDGFTVWRSPRLSGGLY